MYKSSDVEHPVASVISKVTSDSSVKNTGSFKLL